MIDLSKSNPYTIKRLIAQVLPLEYLINKVSLLLGGINAELDIDLIPGWTVVVLANGDPPVANAIAGRIGSWLRRLK